MPARVSALVGCWMVAGLLLSTPAHARNERQAALKAYEAGRYEEAAREILAWCRRKPRDKKGQNTLALIMPRAFRFYQSRAQVAKARRDWDQACEVYEKMVLLQEELQALPPLQRKGKVFPPPRAPAGLLEAYTAVRTEAAAYYFGQAASLEAGHDFEAAAAAYEQASTFISDFRGADRKAAQMRNIAATRAAAQHYADGSRLAAAGKHRQAYAAFAAALEAVPDYQDAAARKAAAQQAGRVTVAVVPLGGRYADRPSGFSQQVISTAIERENPFLKLLDHDTLAGMVGGLGLFGPSDARVLSGIGSAGVDLLLFAGVTDLVEDQPRPSVQRATAYEWIPSRQGFTSRPVTVETIAEQASVTLEVHYKVVAPNTAEVLDAGDVTQSDSDAVEYKTCHCNHKSVFLMPAAGDDMAQGIARAALSKILPSHFAARDTLRSAEEMLSELENAAAADVVERLFAYINTRF